MTRRDCLQTLAAIPLLGRGISLAAPKETEPFRLHYCLSSSLYGTLPLQEILPEVKQTGTTVLDIWPRPHGSQREQVGELGEDRFREMLTEQGLQLGMTTRYDLGPFRLKEELEFVRRFGGKLIVTGAKPGAGATLRDQVKSFVEKLQPHVAEAEKCGVTIAIENHGNSLIESPDSLRYFAEFARSPNLGIALAPYHLPQDPALQASLIEDLGPKLVHFYAWEHGDGCHQKLPKDQELKQLPGRGSFDFAPLIAALRKIQFAGWTQVFMHPVPRGIPILETAGEVTAEINRSRAFLDRL